MSVEQIRSPIRANSYQKSAKPQQKANSGRLEETESLKNINDLKTLPIGIPEHHRYTSAKNGEARIAKYDGDKHYIKATIGTPPEAAEMREAGVANVFYEGWQQQIQKAAEDNGGLGNAEDGFLAWTKVGFVRMYNESLTAEQNQKLATFSLQTGTPLEVTPARLDEGRTVFNQPELNRWVSEFIEQADTKFAAFIEDPTQKMEIRDGRRRFTMQLDQESGMVFSSYYKKSGGIKGFVQRNFKKFAPILDIVGKVGAFIPGWGQVLAVGANVLKMGAQWIAQGTLKAKHVLGDVVGFASNFIPGAGVFGTTIGNWIRTGSTNFRNFVSAGIDTMASGLLSGKDMITSLIRGGTDYLSTAVRNGTAKGREFLESLKNSVVNTLLNNLAAPNEKLPPGVLTVQPQKSALSEFSERASESVLEFAEGVTGSIKGIGQNLWESVGDIGTGLKDLLTFNFNQGFTNISKGLIKGTLQTPVDALIFGGGKALSGIGTLFGVIGSGIELTKTQKEHLSSVFKDSVNLDNVRFKEMPLALANFLNNRPFVLGNSLMVPSGTSNMPLETLIHEITHVWQYQNGGTDYLSEALLAQWLPDSLGGYNITSKALGDKKWGSLNPEQQAEVISNAILQQASGNNLTDIEFNALDAVAVGNGAP